jgi:hypothetical protein
MKKLEQLLRQHVAERMVEDLQRKPAAPVIDVVVRRWEKGAGFLVTVLEDGVPKHEASFDQKTAAIKRAEEHARFYGADYVRLITHAD